ncbi:MarR family winged helix-turn-helix transcriptional regulator [Tenacibaculum sp. XPcli2-G]|uniref:MarR family winged helix-turn-helix transcriptional regulator n=1 Tax=Tenacibaculum sp. XPcli2-G TaxID=2954503 RepID=UPI002096DB8C|nr:MarR family winged helix-turn-helix transcriptional regulator [Tenacibaculum sp. XPcli2-G]MCO7185856.1 MarR family winged helix-turn-helix transcriptional regulator [Tenacibaculum sp. XPcli2-G]
MQKFTTGKLIGNTSRLLNKSLTNSLSEEDLFITSEQWIILQILSTDSKNQKELCDITLKNKSSINSLIKGLLKLKLITKTTSLEDKRNSIISISNEGINIKEKSNNIASSILDKALNDFTEEEINELNNYLLRIIKNLI